MALIRFEPVERSLQEDIDEGADVDEEEDRDSERTTQPDEGPSTPPRLDVRLSASNRSRCVSADPAPTTPLGPHNRNSGGTKTTPVAPRTAVNSPSSLAKQKAAGNNVDPLFFHHLKRTFPSNAMVSYEPAGKNREGPFLLDTIDFLIPF